MATCFYIILKGSVNIFKERRIDQYMDEVRLLERIYSSIEYQELTEQIGFEEKITISKAIKILKPRLSPEEFKIVINWSHSRICS